MKIIIISIIVVLFSWVIYLIPNNFLTLDLFRIKEIKIQVKSKKLTRELTTMANTLYNSNIWGIDLKDMKDFLEKDIRIKNAVVESNSLGKVLIKVNEREIKYYAQMDGKIYLVDENGVLFGFFKDREEIGSYFLKVKNTEEIKELLKICKIIDENILKNIVSQVYIKNKNCVEIILLDKTIIKTNFEVKENKYKIAEHLYYSLRKTNNIEYIDIRFNDFIVKNLGEVNDER